ncbi:MAG: TIGR02757 family protein [Salinivirgaceae bacterium]|jgi:uncharacterized protein (TIGR02757 family)|nr:TIGR02757 family protein [Salinivirgaceae bacterium]
MQHLEDFLNSKVKKYNCTDFIEFDPISIPHNFTTKKDIEISGFLTATIAWGNRKAILKSANQLMRWMDNSPHDFIINHTENDLKPFKNFVYRTFNGKDCIFFLKSLHNIYQNHNGIENVFNNGYIIKESVEDSIAHFRNVFLSIPHFDRSTKHIANPAKGSSAKRINMFLRWMVRKDKAGVDFGIWDKIRMADLLLPLDVHTGNMARKLELLERKSNDWKAVDEVTNNLKIFDKNDPVKYDFALFGLGVNGDF